jgi:hypothetical protein
MSDVLMVALMIMAFAAAAAYAGFCNQLGGRPDVPDGDRR